MRSAVVIVIATAFAAGGFISVVAANEGAADRPERVTLIGCVAQASDGSFALTHATPASTARRWTGSTSAKASTPIAHAVPAIERPRTSGTTTPKGSTPIAVTPARLESSGTNGVNSPKASTPVRRVQAAAYSLISQTELSSHAGQQVEIAGALQPQRVLKVETIHPLAGTCTP